MAQATAEQSRLTAVPPTEAAAKTKAGPSVNGPALTTEHHATIRERARGYFRENESNPDVSQNKVGREIGFTSGAVISAYLAGTYKGDLDRVGRKLEQYLDRQELIKAFGDDAEFFETTPVLEIQEAISLAEATRGIARIVGTTGSGKSRTLQAHAIQTEAILLSGADGLGTPRAVVAQLFAHKACFNKALSRKAPLCDAQRSVIDTLKRSPRTILVDESDYVGGFAAEMLRMIADQTRSALIIAGEKLNTYSGAFEGRIVAEVTIDADAFTVGNVSLIASARLSPGVLNAVIDELMAEARTSGGFRRVRRILQIAQSIAGKAATIDEGDVLNAIRRLRRAKGGAK